MICPLQTLLPPFIPMMYYVLLTASRTESLNPPTPSQSEPASQLPLSINLSTDPCTDPPTPSQLDPIYGTQEQVLMNRVNTVLKELR